MEGRLKVGRYCTLGGVLIEKRGAMEISSGGKLKKSKGGKAIRRGSRKEVEKEETRLVFI